MSDPDLSDTAGDAGQGSIAPKHTGFVKVPNELIGRLLDQGKPTCTALHLLAIKLSRTDWTLNEVHVNRVYGIGPRRFPSAIALMKRTGVLTRKRQGRTFCTETLAAAGGGFVMLPRDVLAQPSNVLAMVLVVLLSPVPLRREDAARRLGITSPTTIRALTGKVISTGAVRRLVGGTGVIYLTRPEVAQNCAHQNCADQNRAHTLETIGSPRKTKDTSIQMGGTVQPAAETGGPFFDPRLDEAFEHHQLLGWVTATEEPVIESFTDHRPDLLAEVSAMITDDELAMRVRTQTRRRVDPLILTAPGLTAIRLFAARVLDTHEDLPATYALDLVLDAIGRLIGDRKARLSSLEVIGKRLAYALAREEARIVAGGLPFDPDEDA